MRRSAPGGVRLLDKRGVITPSIFARMTRSAENYWSAKSLAFEGLEKAKTLAQAIPIALMLVDDRGVS